MLIHPMTRSNVLGLEGQSGISLSSEPVSLSSRVKQGGRGRVCRSGACTRSSDMEVPSTPHLSRILTRSEAALEVDLDTRD
jgi:hypothetical protein